VSDVFWEKLVPGAEEPTVTYFSISRSPNSAFGYEHGTNINTGSLVK
jgi:hypothetical protein